MFWVAKNILVILLGIISVVSCVQAEELSILIIGDSITSNCNQYKHNSIDKVYQIDLQGNRMLAKDPFVWSDCQGGSIWIPLGELILRNKMADQVAFMPISVKEASIEDWLPQGKAYDKFERAMKVIEEKNLKFDYVFWHQDSMNVEVNSKKYQSQFINVVKNTRKLSGLKSSKFIISRHSQCFGSNKEIWRAQTILAKRDNYRIFFLGPDVDFLDKRYQLHNCYLNKFGQLEMAKLWFESLDNARKNENKYKNETLINFFLKIKFWS